MARHRGDPDPRPGPFIGWWRPHRYAPWQQRARGDCWRTTFLALMDAVGNLGKDDSADLLILEVGESPVGDTQHAD